MNLSNYFQLLLKDTSTSYKFLFLNAIIDRVNATDERLLSLDDLIIDMLVTAWYPNQFFKLSFGKQDQIGNLFLSQNFKYKKKISLTSLGFRDKLRQEIVESVDVKQVRNKLSQFVQYRLLSPFFSQQLRGQKESSKNNIIYELAINEFDSLIPLYKIDKSINAIEIHPQWFNYIKQHYSLLFNYIKIEWATYLQKNNPAVPSIMLKLEPPGSRSSLNSQLTFWNSYFTANQDARCIYTGEPLIEIKTSLDHFLPWSFVCHDRLWNLVPVSRSSNSSKSNSLPCLKTYLDKFLEIQYDALKYNKSIMENQKWNSYAQPYLTDLELSNDSELANPNRFAAELAKVVENQHWIAKHSGFDYGWKEKIIEF
ncbi:HNH endonuclease domain-containing protein [Thalassotalea crassostreae]|uniref:HNH endonuclease domain-containing protein n=1 Tax=Thalassotalea crassostreae TaxID=1763536 RepID=UPI000838613A|nr:HNH endonuclease domain-containing protein [Thalassotalea crassostreae]